VDGVADQEPAGVVAAAGSVTGRSRTKEARPGRRLLDRQVSAVGEQNLLGQRQA